DRRSDPAAAAQDRGQPQRSGAHPHRTQRRLFPRRGRDDDPLMARLARGAWGAALVALVVLAHAAEPAKPAPRALPTTAKVWKGDFDAMLERRFMRVLVPYSRTLYYNDKGRERGLTADEVRDF